MVFSISQDFRQGHVEDITRKMSSEVCQNELNS